MFLADGWKDYALLDAGNGMKLQASDGDHGVEYKPLYATYPPNYYVVARVVK